MQYSEKDNGTAIDLDPAEEFDLALPETPTAGYRWAPKEGESTCTILNDARATTGKTGGSGAHTWRFRAPTSGECSIDMEYRRAWETKPARTFTLKIRVRR